MDIRPIFHRYVGLDNRDNPALYFVILGNVIRELRRSPYNLVINVGLVLGFDTPYFLFERETGD